MPLVPLAALLMPHAPRSAGGARRQCPAPIWIQHSPTQQEPTCYKMLRFPAFSRVCRVMFSSQVNVLYQVTSIHLGTRVNRDSRHNPILKQQLRRYGPRSIFPQKSPFRARFGAFYPHPAHQSAPTAAWATHSGHCSPASRPTPNQRLRLGADPPPLATACHRQPSSPSTPLPAAEAEERCFAARADGDGINSPSPLRDRELAVVTFPTGCSPSRHRTAGLLP